MNKNIKQNFFLKVKKVLDEVDKAGDIANHFRGIVLIGDQKESKAYSWLHAPQKDLETLVLSALRNSDEFVLAVAKAFETFYNEQEENKNEVKNEND